MGGSAAFGYGKSDASNQSSSNTYGYSQGVTGSENSQSVYGAQQPALQQLYGAAGDLLGGNSQPGMLAAGLGQQGANAWGQLLQPGRNPFADDAVNASINDATEAFKRQVLPELDARGVGAGAYGSSRDQLARGEAAGMFGSELAGRAAQMRSDLYTGDMQRMLGAVGMTPMLQQSAFAPLSVAASLIGGPTVLGQGSSYGIQNAENWAQSQSSGQSKGRQYNTSASGGLGGGKS